MEARLENFHNDYGNEHFGLAFTVNTIHSNECHMLYHFIRTCLRREEFLRKRGREHNILESNHGVRGMYNFCTC
jgi:hypothetical protein